MSTDLNQLPPLDLLRGFVAVGRRLSITLAANDLHLTQSAVSRQVLALERFLGVRLLVRGHRSIAFTAQGERLFRSADGALQQLQDVTAQLRSTSRTRTVTLSTATGFTALWLLPRLPRFHALHPEIDVRISANNQIVDLRREGIDLAIRYTTPRQAPAGSTRLFGEALAPVAAPSLGVKMLRAGASLARHTLLELDDARSPWLHWQTWLRSAGWPNGASARTLTFNQYDIVIQAALIGQGIALGRKYLVQGLIDEGRLVWLMEPRQAAATTNAYWLVRAEEPVREDVRAVTDWIEGEAAGL
jgi:LysR family glycine cleavage system transcriptional activator